MRGMELILHAKEHYPETDIPHFVQDYTLEDNTLRIWQRY